MHTGACRSLRSACRLRIIPCYSRCLRPTTSSASSPAYSKPIRNVSSGNYIGIRGTPMPIQNPNFPKGSVFTKLLKDLKAAKTLAEDPEFFDPKTPDDVLVTNAPRVPAFD